MAIALAVAGILAVCLAAAALGFKAFSIHRAQRVAEVNQAFADQALSADGAARPPAESRAAERREARDKSRLGQRLAAADLDIGAGQWLAGSAALALACGLAAGAGFSNYFIGLAAALAALMAPSMLLRALAARVTERFSEEFAASLPQIAANMRSGLTPERAMSAVARHASEPLRGELSRVVRELSFGSSLDRSLYAMAARTESKDVKLIATAVELQRETGGNLADVFETVADKIQSRLKLRRHIKSITSPARMSRWILAALPWVVMFTTLFSAEGAAEFWRSAAGIVVICITIVLEIVGVWLMSRICDMKLD